MCPHCRESTLNKNLLVMKSSIAYDKRPSGAPYFLPMGESLATDEQVGATPFSPSGILFLECGCASRRMQKRYGMKGVVI